MRVEDAAGDIWLSTPQAPGRPPTPRRPADRRPRAAPPAPRTSKTLRSSSLDVMLLKKQGLKTR